MNNFKGGGFKHGGSKFAGKGKFGGDRGGHRGGQSRDSRHGNSDQQMHTANCSDCGNKCEVPFRPSGDKPVYCSTCFGAKKNANEPRGELNSQDRSDKGFRNNESSNTKKPRSERSPRHDPSRGRNDEGIEELKQQITALETKLNKILDLLNPPKPSTKGVKRVKNEPAVKVTKKTAKKVPTKKAPAKKVAKKTPVKIVIKKTAPKKVAKKSIKKTAKKK